MANWQDCIVSLIDLIGIKDIILNQNGKGSALMRQLHKIVAVEMNLGLQHHAHAYVWNDSVLLLAYLDGSNLPEIILREVDELKRKLGIPVFSD